MPGRSRRSRDTGPRIGVKAAAQLLGVSERTIERWVDNGTLAGGRPTDEEGNVIPLSHRWVDAEAARAMAKRSTTLSAAAVVPANGSA